MHKRACRVALAPSAGKVAAKPDLYKMLPPPWLPRAATLLDVPVLEDCNLRPPGGEPPLLPAGVPLHATPPTLRRPPGSPPQPPRWSHQGPTTSRLRKSCPEAAGTEASAVAAAAPWPRHQRRRRRRRRVGVGVGVVVDDVAVVVVAVVVTMGRGGEQEGSHDDEEVIASRPQSARRR